MTKIILEHLDHNVHIWIDYPDDFNKALDNGKTLIQNINDDIASNIDSTGWSKYREVLKELKIIPESDVSKWDIKPGIGILPETKKVLESISANP